MTASVSCRPVPTRAVWYELVIEFIGLVEPTAAPFKGFSPTSNRWASQALPDRSDSTKNTER